MSVFEDKTIFVAGAASDVVWRLLPAFESAKARVVLMDEDADELMSMARKSPARFDPLPVTRLNAKTCAAIGGVWQDEPIDIFLDFLALTDVGQNERMLAASRACVRAFEPALMAADGCVVSAIPAPAREDDLAAKIIEAGHLQLARSMSDRWARWQVCYNVLRPAAGASASAIAQAVDIAVQAGWRNFTGVHVPIRSAAH
ncbi:MAG: hypothetical protein JXQ85_05675 [Cognatishimia sp.]|uniref:hypothetical protein n=1 Tax=Cognatishimia sp. TaxID=2211648 RepID=UPI003B8B3097